MKEKFPKHVDGLLEYLLKGRERANEDRAVEYFRWTFQEEFDRQRDAKNADGHVKGKLSSYWNSSLLGDQLGSRRLIEQGPGATVPA